MTVAERDGTSANKRKQKRRRKRNKCIAKRCFGHTETKIRSVRWVRKAAIHFELLFECREAFLGNEICSPFFSHLHFFNTRPYRFSVAICSTRIHAVTTNHCKPERVLQFIASY